MRANKTLLAGIAFCGLALTECGSADTVKSIFSTNGFGMLRFGMTEKEALATGEIAFRQPGGGEGGCTGYHLAAYPDSTDEWIVIISPKYGLVEIGAEPGMRTPEGITIGSTIKDVEAAYGSV